MMKQNEQTECAMAVVLAVFDFIQLVGDEIVYDVNRASEQRKARTLLRRCAPMGGLCYKGGEKYRDAGVLLQS